MPGSSRARQRLYRMGPIMKRKVVKHGSATLTISIPSKWAKKFAVKSGDELEIDEEEGSIIIKSPAYHDSVKETAIDLGQMSVLGRRCLIALFKGGCDTIRITYPNPQVFNEIVMPTLNEFIGFEIMQQSEKHCVIKEISGLTDNTELDSLIRRMFLLIISLSDDCAAAIESGNHELLNDLISRDVTINRVANFSRRLLYKRGSVRAKDLPMTYYIIEELENLGDEYKYMCRYLHENNLKIKNPEVYKIMRQANGLIREFHTLYFKFSFDRADKLTCDRDDTIRSIVKAFETKSVADVRVLDHLARISNIISNMLGPLLTMRLPELCMVTDAPVKK